MHACLVNNSDRQLINKILNHSLQHYGTCTFYTKPKATRVVIVDISCKVKGFKKVQREQSAMLLNRANYTYT